MKRVVVVGGGWSGLTATWALTQQGYEVILLEAASQLGGRARTLTLPEGLKVDNGQHLLSGAYTETLRLIQQFHPLDQALIDVGQRIAFRDGNRGDRQWALKPALGFPPWNLWPWIFQIPGLSLGQRLKSLWGFARWIHALMGAAENRALFDEMDQTVAEHLRRFQIHSHYLEHVLQPLCLATMNAPLEEISLYRFARVFSDLFGRRPNGGALLLPQIPLGDLFVDPMAQAIRLNGGEIRTRMRVQRLLFEGAARSGVLRGVETADGIVEADHIILALPLRALSFLLKDTIDLQDEAVTLDRMPHRAIRTDYWICPEGTVFEKGHAAALLGWIHGPCDWFFYRPDIMRNCFSAVTSDAAHQPEKTTQAILAVLQRQFKIPALRLLKTITEKHATFLPYPGSHQTLKWLEQPCFNLYFCGDHAYPDFPATLESAVRSGLRAAQQVTEFMQRNGAI